jgi:hypothetical protein
MWDEYNEMSRSRQSTSQPCPHEWIDEEHVPLIKATFLFLYSSGDGRLSLNGEEAAIVLGEDSDGEKSGKESTWRDCGA